MLVKISSHREIVLALESAKRPVDQLPDYLYGSIVKSCSPLIVSVVCDARRQGREVSRLPPAYERRLIPARRLLAHDALGHARAALPASQTA